MSAIIYYATPDPADADRITYWRRGARGEIKPWPTSAKYGPVLHRDHVPVGITDPVARHDWVAAWYRDNSMPWHAEIRAAIAADPGGCAKRFAEFTSRCCRCGRALTDPASKTYGIGPECRDGAPAWLLAALTELVGRAHAQVGDS